jgi:hypothetical protein
VIRRRISTQRFSLFATWRAGSAFSRGDRYLQASSAPTIPGYRVHLTPDQQTAVDKLIRLPETVNVGVVNLGEKGPRDNEGYTRIYLPLADGKQVALVRTQPTVKTEKGFTWRGQVEGAWRAGCCHVVATRPSVRILRLPGRVYMISHAGGDIHTMAEIDPEKLPPDHPPGTQDTRAPGIWLWVDANMEEMQRSGRKYDKAQRRPDRGTAA